MQKILITGGCGFVGRHFARRFLERGDEVHIVDAVIADTGGIHPNAGWPLFDPRHCGGFHFYHQDCREWFHQRQDSDFDYALHLAAMVGGRLIIENNPLAVADDLSIDAAYWQWARRAQPRKTVTFSSSAAYPIKYQRVSGYRLLSEEMIDLGDDIGMPDMTYGWAKLTCEYLGKLAFQKHGLRSVAYRPFSGYGEDQDDNYPFPSICKRALRQKDAAQLTVWGTGDQMRDFIHIEDCVDGVLATVDKVDDGDALNLSTGILTTFKTFARLAAEICGYSPEIIGTSDRPEGVFARGGSTDKQKQFGFSHRISFEAGVRRAMTYLERAVK
jgi:nucleoside-diphosphate-sugar epimerase